MHSVCKKCSVKSYCWCCKYISNDDKVAIMWYLQLLQQCLYDIKLRSLRLAAQIVFISRLDVEYLTDNLHIGNE